MDNHIFKLQNGKEVELNEDEMQQVHEYFQHQSTADYIRESYPQMEEAKVQQYAAIVRARMDKYGCSESEAIEDVLCRKMQTSAFFVFN